MYIYIYTFLCNICIYIYKIIQKVLSLTKKKLNIFVVETHYYS